MAVFRILSFIVSPGCYKFSLGIRNSRGAEEVGFGAGLFSRKCFDFRAQNGEIRCILDAAVHSWAACVNTQLQI